jgi:predicted nucleic acid-binding protein
VNVLVDTSVWSLAVRRASQSIHPYAKELAELIRDGRVVIIGAIRQELLSGVKNSKQFVTLRGYLRAFRDVVAETEDFERAAEFYNKCRAKGIQGSNIDFLICAIAVRQELAIFTTDADFHRYARILAIHLHEVGNERT